LADENRRHEVNPTSSAQRRRGEPGAPAKERIVKDMREGLRLIQNSEQGGDRLPVSRLRVIAAVIALTALIAAGLHWPQGGAGPAVQETTAQPFPEPGVFDYFPSQFVNQGKEVEEQVQPF